MPLSSRVAAVCDDVRQELGNKLTLVGLYNDIMTFGPGAGPFGLAKLASVFVVAGLRGIRRLAFRHTMAVIASGMPAVPAVENQPLQRLERPDEVLGLDEHH